jgi:hypothetical protein
VNEQNSPVLTEMQNQYDQPPKVDFDSFAKQAGFDTEAIKTQVQMEGQAQNSQIPKPGAPAAEPGLEDNSGAMAANAMVNKNSIKKDLAKGMVQGTADLAQGAANAVISVADWVENTAASYGLGKGDLIDDSDRIDWAKKLQSPEDTVTTKVARGITKVAVPMIASAPFTGPVGMVAAAGATSFLTADQNEDRLANMVKDIPSVRNFPAVYGALDWMSHKPGETDLEARAKSALENVIIAAPIAGLFHGATKAISMARQAKNAEKLVQGAEEVITSAETGAMKINNPDLPDNVTPISTHPMYNYEPTVTGADGAVKANANSADVIDVLREYRQSNPELSMKDILNVPGSYAERDAGVKAFMGDKAQMQSLLAWRRGDRPLTDIETKVLQHMSRDVVDEIRDFSKIAAESKNPEDLTHMQNLLGYLEHTLTLEDGTGSAASKTLDANKLLADIQGMPVEKAVAAQTEAQRKMLLKQVLRNAGGEEATRETAKKLQAIAEMGPDKISEMVARMDASKVPAWKRVSNAVTQVAINGMLSSLKTTVGNHLSNGSTFIKGVGDAYTAAGINWVQGLTGSAAEGVTFAQANAQLKGSLGSMREAFGAMGQAMRTGKGGPANIVNADILDVKGSLSGLRLMPGVTEDSSAAMQVLAKIADKTDLAVGLPSRLNSTADSFWGTLMYRGRLHSNAIAEAEKAGLAGEKLQSFVQDFITTPTFEQHEMARAYAMENTFSKALDPKGKAQALQSVFDKLPLGRVIFPFFKTQANIIEYGVKNSPLGLMRPEFWQAMQTGGREAQLAAAQIGTGSMMIGLFAYEAATGNVTGDDTRNPGTKQALSENGSQFVPHALKTSDGQIVDLRRIEPLNSFVRLGAAVAKISGHVSEEERQSIAWAAGSHMAAFLTPEMMVDTWGDYLKTIGSVAKTADEPNARNLGEAQRNVETTLAKVGTSLTPFSGLARDVKNEMDPTKRDTSVEHIHGFTDRLIAKYKSVTPWFSEDMPAMRNMFGEKIATPDGIGPDIISPLATSNTKNASPLTKQLSKLAGFYEDNRSLDPDMKPMSINMPARDFQVGSTRIDLTPQEYERFVMYSAGLDPKTEKSLGGIKPLREALDNVTQKIAPMFEGQMSPQQYKQATGMLNEVILTYKNLGKEMMFRDPEVQKRWHKAYTAQQTVRQLPGIQEK